MDPIEPAKHARMNAIAKVMDEFLNGKELPGLPRGKKQFGFALLVFDFNEIKAGRMNWISNADRADMITALKEMTAQLEGRVQDAPETKQ